MSRHQFSPLLLALTLAQIVTGKASAATIVTNSTVGAADLQRSVNYGTYIQPGGGYDGSYMREAYSFSLGPPSGSPGDTLTYNVHFADNLCFQIVNPQPGYVLDANISLPTTYPAVIINTQLGWNPANIGASLALVNSTGVTPTTATSYATLYRYPWGNLYVEKVDYGWGGPVANGATIGDFTLDLTFPSDLRGNTLQYQPISSYDVTVFISSEYDYWSGSPPDSLIVPAQASSPTPEPGTLAIWSLLGGLGTAGGWLRRRCQAV